MGLYVEAIYILLAVDSLGPRYTGQWFPKTINNCMMSGSYPSVGYVSLQSSL